MSHVFAKIGIYVMPVFKNGKVLRVSVPRYVARLLALSPGDFITFRQNKAGEIVVDKFNVEKLRDEYIQGRASQLVLGTGSAVAPCDGAGTARGVGAVDSEGGVAAADHGETGAERL